MKLLKH
ncbi:UNVERIFIED_CONTAM: hypothetical protein GTU68_014654 [Idotea baltica]|nr:hypothetical protein [Idotea baltica]